MRFDTVESYCTKSNRWIAQIIPLCGVVFFLIVIGQAAEIYLNSNADRQDWIDWWFWARQNLSQLTESGQIVGIVMSPVQGLFGQSCPVSPFFHPLWGLAARIDDPVLAHRVSITLVFVLYSAIVWFVATRFIQNKIFVLATTLVCLNLFFDVIPVTEIYLLPKSNFDYFQIVPPHTLSFLLAIAVFAISVTVKPCIWKVIANLGCITLAVLADPLHPIVFFLPIIFLVGIFYLLDIKYYAKEILLSLSGVVILYYVGIFEYSVLLPDTTGRSVFNEYLFHHTKRHDSATFAFQNKQNLIFIGLSAGLLIWNTLKKRDRLSGSVLAIQILFLVTGCIYLSTDLNLNFLPNTMIFESNVIPIYVILSMHALENLIQTLGEKIKTPVLWVTLAGLGLFVLGKVVTIDLTAVEGKEHFSQEKLLIENYTDNSVFPGSTTFLLGTRGSQLSRLNKLDAPFSKKHVTFTQNNEHSSQFLGKYDHSVAIVSYWLNEIPTLEENNLVTNPFYMYFFRNLFMRDDDYYMTNLNFFTYPRLHLYPMLGVRHLFSDVPTDRSQPFDLSGTMFFKTTFPNYNYGQYSPKKSIRVESAREALVAMGDPSFNPTREYVVLNDDILTDDLSAESTGQINYESNGIRFTGNSNGKTLHVLPVVFSNCLKSENGNRLVRVNLLLTGIVFTGQVSDRISYSGPPFSNDCLKKDISDVDRFNLRDREYAYPIDADKASFDRFLASPWH
mgnify:CR=1 FL=1